MHSAWRGAHFSLEHVSHASPGSGGPAHGPPTKTLHSLSVQQAASAKQPEQPSLIVVPSLVAVPSCKQVFT